MDPARLLVTFGASTCLQDHLYGNTALHWAVTARNVTAVQTLLKAGADTAVTNKQVSRDRARPAADRVSSRCHSVPDRVSLRWYPVPDRVSFVYVLLQTMLRSDLHRLSPAWYRDRVLAVYLQGETAYDLAKRHKISWMGNRWLTELEPPGRVRRNPCQTIVSSPVGVHST